MLFQDLIDNRTKPETIPEDPQSQEHSDTTKHAHFQIKGVEEPFQHPLGPGTFKDQQSVPHALRSSFVFGQAAPDAERFESIKEEERKKWLAELEKQMEDKRIKEIKGDGVNTSSSQTWADKLGTYQPSSFPEQPKNTISGMGDPFVSVEQTATSVEPRSKSAPEGADDDKTFLRGQNVNVDPATRRELEEKRRKYLEHQEAVRKQVEEKQRLKEMERLKKMQEDMEEERKLQQERDMLQKQFETEQKKLRQKEAQRQAQVEMLKAAMDDAQAKAMQDKYTRKMEHLERGGHDVSKLRENLEAKITPRATAPTHIEPNYVPGLDFNSPRQAPFHQAQPVNTSVDTTKGVVHDNYTENRVLTPSRYRHPSKPHSDPNSPRREFGTQTGMPKLSDHDQNAWSDDESARRDVPHEQYQREPSEVQIEYRIEKGKKVRVISAPKEEVIHRNRKMPHPPEPPPGYHHHHHHVVVNQKQKEEEEKRKKLEAQRRRGPVRAGSRPKWNYKNPVGKKPVKQSEKDPFFEKKKRESNIRRYQREKKLLAMVEANKQVIPDYYMRSPRDHSPMSDYGGRTPRDVSQEYKSPRRAKSHSPARTESQLDYLPVYHGMGSTSKGAKSPGRNRSVSPEGEINRSERRRSKDRSRSPPVPAIRHRLDPTRTDDRQNFPPPREPPVRKGKNRYLDDDPLEVPVANGDFVPFTRTIEVLDPAYAEAPLPMSRENSKITNARKAYYGSLQPADFGGKVNVYEDKDRMPNPPNGTKNPLLNPGLVTDHPTTRQDAILQQLSTLKQSLMQRQRELETFSPTDLE